MLYSITQSGHLLIDSGIDCDALIDFILSANYPEEFCLSLDFSHTFIDRLMKAGFLVMSTEIGEADDKQIILMPKHHIIRTVLFFENLHIGKTVKRLLNKFELRADTDFDTIVDRCIKIHGDAWLTVPLIDSLKNVRRDPESLTRPFSFALYNNGKLAAGEFGVVSGRVYTSYSGYYEENNAGRVQMILTAMYLQKNGFAFWDLGMPLDYKYSLGAHDINTKSFMQLFRNAQ
jgi:Leu/Phe-tRNA-protein transferase